MRNLKGERFGRLIVIERFSVSKWGNVLWLCKCDCGKDHIAASNKLIQGKTQSCGCLANDIRASRFTKHGILSGGKPRTFIIWCGIKARCTNPKCVEYSNYGKRGIDICDDWMEFENFHKWAISNGYSDELQIDRIDNNKGYSPDNCRFVTRQQNASNKSNTRFVTLDGETHTITEWSRMLGVSRDKVAKLERDSKSKCTSLRS